MSQIVCCDCSTKIKHLTLDSKVQPGVQGVFQFEGEIRQLIIQSKVTGNLWSTSFLSSKFCDRFADLHQDTIDGIVSVAPSLWSRLKGRYDLAAFVARSLGELRSLPYSGSPPSLGWHLRKKSFTKKSLRGTPKKHKSAYFLDGYDKIWARCWLQKVGPNPVFLVVDDVATTGTSLEDCTRKILRVIPQATVFQAVLAIAGNR